jgi:hypothetical protein
MKRFTRSTFAVVGLLLLASTLIAASPAKEKEEVRIGPWMDHVTIGPGQKGVIRWGWGTCTRGLTEDHIRATEQEYRLVYEDEVIQEIRDKKAARHWGKPHEHDGPIELCIWPARATWLGIWEFKRLKLRKPGLYELEVYIALSEPLIDGFDSDQDGEADVYEGVRYNKVITIEVIE